MMRPFLLFPVFLTFTTAFTPGDGAAETAAAPVKQKTVIVTSLEKCLTQLDPESALDVQQNYIKPYQECRARLHRKLQEKKTAAARKEEAAAAPETPRNYVRVTPGRQNAPVATEKKEAVEPAKK